MINPVVPINFWKKCSICKKPINFGSNYYLCNVSTCRNERTGMRFCSMPCWDAHLGYVNHRPDAYAEEQRSPTFKPLEDSSQRDPVRKVIREADTINFTSNSNKPIAIQANSMPSDTLVVVSKVKKLVSEQSSFNTSQCCIDRLTKKVIEECLKGIKKAELAGRKTVMGRDIE